jgi:hypothetical protein
MLSEQAQSNPDPSKHPMHAAPPSSQGPVIIALSEHARIEKVAHT